MTVNLDQIERRKDSPPGSEMWQLVAVTVAERDAMVEALRDAREALLTFTLDSNPTRASASIFDGLRRLHDAIDFSESPDAR